MVSAEKEAGGGQMYKHIFFTLSKYIQTSNRNTAGIGIWYVQRRQSNLKSGRSARGGGGTFLGIYDEPPLLQKPMYIIEYLGP